MTQEDGQGICDRCGAGFAYALVHNGFNDSTHAYCDACGSTAILNLLAMERRLGALPRRVVPIPRRLEPHLAPCACGGRFRGSAVPRCPQCLRRLSARRAARWIQAGSAGTRHGWRWPRTWKGLYAIVLAGRVVFDPWIGAFTTEA